MRYSPRPIESYDRVIKGGSYGPHNSAFLNYDLEAWNLAFLSYDYDARPTHPDPQFTILAIRTVNTVLNTGALDLLGLLPASMTVRSLLRMPAPQAVKVLLEKSLFQRLPLYKAYGQTWLDTIQKRSWICRTQIQDKEAQLEDIESTAEVREILKNIFNSKP